MFFFIGVHKLVGQLVATISAILVDRVNSPSGRRYLDLVLMVYPAIAVYQHLQYIQSNERLHRLIMEQTSKKYPVAPVSENTVQLEESLRLHQARFARHQMFFNWNIFLIFVLGNIPLLFPSSFLLFYVTNTHTKRETLPQYLILILIFIYHLEYILSTSSTQP
jgi:hypothetical protein